MAGVFRFSNAVSDIDKFIVTYKKIFSNFKSWTEDNRYFNHSDAAEFLAQNGLATSLGAIGEEALARSILRGTTEDNKTDKSRDPLYNQHKSYSEMFRMLGWYEPGNMQTNFRLSEFGAYVAETESPDVMRKIVGINILHIASPNPLTTVKGNNILRPFPFIIKIMHELGGMLSRDELIISVLACENDITDSALRSAVSKIRDIRSNGRDALAREMEALKLRQNIKSKDTLPNYTRFPISALKWLGIATAVNSRSVYNGKPVKMLKLTEKGEKLGAALLQMPDVRYDSLSKYESEARIAFIALSNLQKLDMMGFDIGEYAAVIPILQEKASPVITGYGIEGNRYLFFGYQEASRADLHLVDKLLEEII